MDGEEIKKYILEEKSNHFENNNKNKSQTEKINIYQIFTRLFGNQKKVNKEYGTIEENGVGKFNDINDVALTAIRNLGITHVWYTGVIEHAVLTDYSNFGISLDDADVVKGRAGSPYAIKDYYDVNPDLATDVQNRMKEFEALLERTHKNNLKALIDFVPNHVARKYASDAKPDGITDLGQDDDTNLAFSPQNNFYYLPGRKFEVPKGYQSLGSHPFKNKDSYFEEFPAKATGNDQFTHQPGINDWFETVKLNYGRNYYDHTNHFDPIPSTWKKMLEILLFWTKKGVDGFRCDMAEMVPVEFWSWVIPQVKETNPEIIFIAEIYNPNEYRNYIKIGKFDFLYDKVQLYDTLRNLTVGKGKTEYITGIWQYLRGINQHMLRFLENHDEQRIASHFFAGDPFKAFPAMVVTATLFTGPLMIYFGQEVGEPAVRKEGFSGEDGRTTIFDYWGVPEHQKWMNNRKFDGGMLSVSQKELRSFYQRLLSFTLENEAIVRGKLLDLQPLNKNNTSNSYEKIYPYLRFTDKEKLLIITNFNDYPLNKISLNIPQAALKALHLHSKDIEFSFVFSHKADIHHPLEFSAAYSDMGVDIIFSADPYSALIFRMK